MTNVKSTKRALVSSILALFLCFAMLLGTTYAWFTDSVSSDENIIKSGTLDVEMFYAEGTEDPANAEWIDASKKAIFNYDKWEPGYAEAKHIKVTNEGTLALKYQMRVIANGVVSVLADVIDVYYFDEAVALTRDNLTEAVKLGTLREVLTVSYAKNLETTISGNLAEGESKSITLVFKMQETAGNEYQNLSIGSDFSIQILATQYTAETDSFDEKYDQEADFAPQEIPAANVFALSLEQLQNITVGSLGVTLDTGYSFVPTETYEQASESAHEWSHADFFIYADKDVPANSLALAGFYKAFEGFSWGGQTLSETNWIGLTSDTDIAAGKENGVRLLGDGMGMPGVSYSEICNFGNDGTGFLCGATDVTGANEGTTLTVELRVYETECDDPGCHHNSFDCETSEYEVIGTFTYTFDDPTLERLDDGTVVRYTDNGEVVLHDVSAVEAATYYVPDGVTVLRSGVFAQNAGITTVVVSDTVTDFGATGVSETNASSGAFKGSAVETVDLPEGMTEIPAAAFNGATNLKSVNIPASVETIGVNAFRSTALETLTVPATVKTISYGAFRDMDSLTTVTIEGDVHIPNYAFRDCSALRTVYINGENATVGSNMAFANASSNNPGTNNITFYVKNSTVASQIKTCMGVGTDYWIYINGEEVTVKNVKNLAEFQKALDEAVDGDIICFAADITGDATVVQKANTKIMIDGCGYELAGTITIDGKSARYETAALTIKNVTFDDENGNGKAYINLGKSGDSNTRYTNNVTIQDCVFKGYGDDEIDGAVAVKSYTGGDWNLTLDNLTVDAGMHSMLQVTNVEKGLKIVDCKVNSKNGINLNNTVALEMSGCEFDVRGYAVRVGVNGNTTNGTYTIANSTLKSLCNDGDAVIICRGTMTGSTLTLTNTTLVGERDITGNAQVVNN